MRFPLYGISIYNVEPNLHNEWLESGSELYRPSDRCLLAKSVSNFGERGCHVVSVTDPYGRNLGFSRPEPLLFKVAPQLYSRG
jgi:hypothetical protein